MGPGVCQRVTGMRAATVVANVAGLLAAATLLIAGCNADIGDSAASDAAPAAADASAVSPLDAAPVVDPPDAAPACTAGDAQIQDGAGICYMYFGTALTHDAAETACAQLGAHLAVITSQAENLFFSAIAPSAVDSDIWIGGSDAVTEGSWLWIDGETWGYTHWRTGEPNNGGASGIPENCNVIEGDHNIANEGCQWDDRDCSRLYPYICERD